MEINILEIGSENPYTFPDVNEHNSIALFHTFVKSKQITNSHSNQPIKSKTRKPSIPSVVCDHDHYSSEFKNIPDSVARFNIENRNSFVLIVWENIESQYVNREDVIRTATCSTTRPSVRPREKTAH